MSEIITPIITDETGQHIAEKLHTQNMLLGMIAGASMEEMTSMREVRKIVQAKKGPDLFNPGDTFTVPWTDTATGTKYAMPFNVVHHGDVTLEDGEVVPGMYLQCKYALPFGVQFDQREAFYAATDAALPAGTYNITMDPDWGTVKKNMVVQFVLTKDVPKGGVLAGFDYIADRQLAQWKVSSYATNASAEPIETVSVSEGSAGSSLGRFNAAGSDTVNSIHRLGYGYNRWSQSAIRQWLNSTAGKGSWWASQNKFDRVPDENATKAGFMSGFDADFLESINPVKVVTALNTITDAAAGETETTYDTFFLPSLEQMSINPQLAGEGDTFEYWKRASKLGTKMAQWQTYPQIRTFALENHTSARYVRLRSAYRGGGCHTWYATPDGYVTNNSAYGAFRSAPVCVVC